MQDEPVVGIHHVFDRNAFEQFEFYIQRCFTRGQAGTVAKSKQVCVYGHGGLAKGHIQHHIGGFSAYAGQCLKCVARARHLATMQVNQHLARLHQMARFAAVQANGFDVTLKTI
jgi:hypothetical protein